ncbi:MAG: type II toxin-antitoxin system RelE/ParE family toxin [Nitrospirae bacterium]|nr:type II toxin-antitoxin system RelE/ParE family toxin [Nitrospirota bacterium]
MKIEILEIARLEFEEAKEFYEIEQSGLGARFEDEIRNSLLRIQQYPQAWQSERREIRRYILHKFPYKILYSIQDDKIVVLAFAHLHRKPDYWIDRIE